MIEFRHIMELTGILIILMGLSLTGGLDEVTIFGNAIAVGWAVPSSLLHLKGAVIILSASTCWFAYKYLLHKNSRER